MNRPLEPSLYRYLDELKAKHFGGVSTKGTGTACAASKGNSLTAQLFENEREKPMTTLKRILNEMRQLFWPSDDSDAGIQRGYRI